MKSTARWHCLACQGCGQHGFVKQSAVDRVNIVSGQRTSCGIRIVNGWRSNAPKVCNRSAGLLPTVLPCHPPLLRQSCHVGRPEPEPTLSLYRTASAREPKINPRAARDLPYLCVKVVKGRCRQTEGCRCRCRWRRWGEWVAVAKRASEKKGHLELVELPLFGEHRRKHRSVFKVLSCLPVLTKHHQCRREDKRRRLTSLILYSVLSPPPSSGVPRPTTRLLHVCAPWPRFSTIEKDR